MSLRLSSKYYVIPPGERNGTEVEIIYTRRVAAPSRRAYSRNNASGEAFLRTCRERIAPRIDILRRIVLPPRALSRRKSPRKTFAGINTASSANSHPRSFERWAMVVCARVIPTARDRARSAYSWHFSRERFIDFVRFSRAPRKTSRRGETRRSFIPPFHPTAQLAVYTFPRTILPRRRK